MGGEKFVKCPVCVFNANQPQTALKDDILLMFKSPVRQPNLNSYEIRQEGTLVPASPSPTIDSG